MVNISLYSLKQEVHKGNVHVNKGRSEMLWHVTGIGRPGREGRGRGGCIDHHLSNVERRKSSCCASEQRLSFLTWINLSAMFFTTAVSALEKMDRHPEQRTFFSPKLKNRTLKL